jgi:hypothetical protein
MKFSIVAKTTTLNNTVYTLRHQGIMSDTTHIQWIIYTPTHWIVYFLQRPLTPFPPALFLSRDLSSSRFLGSRLCRSPSSRLGSLERAGLTNSGLDALSRPTRLGSLGGAGLTNPGLDALSCSCPSGRASSRASSYRVPWGQVGATRGASPCLPPRSLL